MIVSASYRSDIPAFYGRWFLARLAAGFCRVANPYGRQAYEVPLTRDAVDGFVFWTRNVGPFLGALDAVRERGHPFVVQHTITGYPRALEAGVLEAGRAVVLLRQLANRFGRRSVVWRYDPVLVSDLTPLEWHAENFARLAAALAGAADEVVVSFAQIYRKSRRNLDAAAGDGGFGWRDPDPEEKLRLLASLVPIAAAHGMQLALCTQPDLKVTGAVAARCVDAGRLSELAGRPIGTRTKGNRPGCLCAESRDIGAYDSCPQGCAYCYAVSARRRAQHRLQAHDTGSEFLIGPRG